MSVTNPDKVVTKQDLADFYEGIFPYLGGMPEVLANKFSRSDIFSTDEKMIGQWTDGKPIYQKTITGQLFPLSSWNTAIEANYSCSYIHNISNIDYIVNISGFAYWSGDNTHYIIMGNNCDTRMDCTKTVLKLLVPKTGTISPYTDYASAIYNITIQYTKTTDSATSIGVDTDYSTTEKIIGTWIDGKPLYQKVLTGTVPTCSTNATGVTSLVSVGATVDSYIKVSCMSKSATSNSYMDSATYFPDYPIGTENKYVGLRLFAYPNNASTTANKNKVAIVNSSTANNNATYALVIQYTKTTDT